MCMYIIHRSFFTVLFSYFSISKLSYRMIKCSNSSCWKYLKFYNVCVTISTHWSQRSFSVLTYRSHYSLLDFSRPVHNFERQRFPLKFSHLLCLSIALELLSTSLEGQNETELPFSSDAACRASLELQLARARAHVPLSPTKGSQREKGLVADHRNKASASLRRTRECFQSLAFAAPISSSIGWLF